MNTAEKIQKNHLQKIAIIYVRQSTQSQLMNNRQSLELQYALKLKAINYGWDASMISIIDTDLGVTGSGRVKRDGFQQMLLKVTSGEVGIVFAYDVTRLSRNCGDWYGLLDICGYKGTLIGDSDGIYNPLDVNDRLLLGLKGQLAEFELRTIRARMNAGLMNKVKKGEVHAFAAAGYVKSPLGNLEVDPNEDVKANIQLVFNIFEQEKSVSKVLTYFKKNNLELVRSTPKSEIIWKEATHSALLRILKNPAYAGIYAYGKTKTSVDLSIPCGQKRSKVAQKDWSVFIKDNHQSYITKKQWTENQLQIGQNYAEYRDRQSKGVPRTGKSLLHGLLYCGKCGHKMYVVYKDKNCYYKCSQERRSKRKQVCEVISASNIDNAVSDAFIEAMNPAEIDAYNSAIKSRNKTYDQTQKLLQKRLERKKYEAMIREKQYLSVDPENRLVASTLEKNWENSLKEISIVEDARDQHNSRYLEEISIPKNLKELFREAGQNLGQLWHQENVIPMNKKKELVRTLIEKINISRLVREVCLIRIVWKGGYVSEIKQPIKINKLEDLSNYLEFMKVFTNLYDLGYTDASIAQEMTQMNFRGAASLMVTKQMIKGLRLKLKMYNDTRGKEMKKVIKEEYLSVADLMKLVNKGRTWVHYHISAGNITGVKSPQKHNIYLFPNTKDFINKVKNLGRLIKNERVERQSASGY